MCGKVQVALGNAVIVSCFPFENLLNKLTRSSLCIRIVMLSVESVAMETIRLKICISP